MSKIGEWILRLFSDEEARTVVDEPEWERGRELHKICRRIPWMPAMVRGTQVLDFGSGSGYQAARMAEMGAERVVGVEIQDELRKRAVEVASDYGVSESVAFYERLPEPMRGQFDVILSQNAMEHYPDPGSVLRVMKEALSETGRVVVSFGPLWWHPYGAHIHYFTRIPWPHVWFSEDTIMAVRADYRDDEASAFEEVRGGLNRMTVARFRRLVARLQFDYDYFHVEAIKDWDVLARIPGLREVVAKNVFAILRHEGAPCSERVSP